MKLTINFECGCTAEAQIQLLLFSSSLILIPSIEKMLHFPLQPPINKYESLHKAFIVKASRFIFLLFETCKTVKI